MQRLYTYELPRHPVLIDLGKAGKATVRSSVPFLLDSVLHCADFTHTVSTGRSAEVFQALGAAESPGVLKVWTGV